ncbi:MAG TPA: TatD family hydrolase, partial [Actinomycetota bacterium]|nr:TatD family hydrolase [Actinomycetota bacterium]
PEDVMSRAFDAGVVGVVTVGTDLESSRSSVALAEKFPAVWASVGLHPHEASHLDEGSLDELRGLAAHPKVVAIGEIGLDYFRDHSPRADQRRAFDAQLSLAEEIDKPVILHVRDAFEDVLDVLAGHSLSGIVFHCFSGGPLEASRAVAIGGYVSLAGNVSYRTAQNLRDAAKATPLDRLLVETDAPYLAPVPMRGRPNEPAYVVHVGSALAIERRMPEADLAATTHRNAVRVFGITTRGRYG